jgi:hypothetical protein
MRFCLLKFKAEAHLKVLGDARVGFDRLNHRWCALVGFDKLNHRWCALVGFDKLNHRLVIT